MAGGHYLLVIGHRVPYNVYVKCFAQRILHNVMAKGHYHLIVKGVALYIKIILWALGPEDDEGAGYILDASNIAPFAGGKGQYLSLPRWIL